MNQDYSIWERDAFSKLWDIGIIGSGITGLSTGISILERAPESKVLVMDRGFIPLGASTRNAGFACFGSPSEILDDIISMGESEAMSLVQKRWLGLKKLLSRLDQTYAQYESHGGYEVYFQKEYEQIYDQLPYLNRLVEDVIHVKDVYQEVEIPKGIRGFDKAIFNRLEGQLHPGYMIQYLKEKFLALGGEIYTGITLEHLEEQEDRVALQSSFSIPMEVKKVIVTTNAFAKQLLPELEVDGARNHVLVTTPISGLSWKGCFHFDQGYYYFRNIGDRILLGGARNRDLDTENTNEFGRNPVIMEALERFLNDHLISREQGDIAFQWSGIIGIGSQKSPIIRKLSPRVFAGVRLSGMGIALASLIGEELAEMALQQE